MQETIELLFRAIPDTIEREAPDRPLIIEREQDGLEDEEEPAPSFIYVGEYSGQPQYYSPLRDDVVGGELHDGEFTERTVFDDRDATGLAENVLAMVRTATEHDVETTLSDQALGVAIGHLLAERGVLPSQQSKVYALREIGDVDRQRTASVLGLSPNTVDNHSRSAREKVRDARELAETLDTIDERTPTDLTA